MNTQNKLCKCKNRKDVNVEKFNTLLLQPKVLPIKYIDNDKISEHTTRQIKIFDPWQRLYNYAKMKSVSRKKEWIQGDELDFVLTTSYQHNLETFPEKCDVYYQNVTLEKQIKKYGTSKFQKSISWRSFPEYDTESLDSSYKPENMHKPVYSDHPLIIGGITERIHPSSIKLMNSSHHSPQTNAGYVRQDRDGNLFQY